MHVRVVPLVPYEDSSTVERRALNPLILVRIQVLVPIVGVPGVVTGRSAKSRMRVRSPPPTPFGRISQQDQAAGFYPANRGSSPRAISTNLAESQARATTNEPARRRPFCGDHLGPAGGAGAGFLNLLARVRVSPGSPWRGQAEGIGDGLLNRSGPLGLGNRTPVSPPIAGMGHRLVVSLPSCSNGVRVPVPAPPPFLHRLGDSAFTRAKRDRHPHGGPVPSVEQRSVLRPLKSATRGQHPPEGPFPDASRRTSLS